MQHFSNFSFGFVSWLILIFYQVKLENYIIRLINILFSKTRFLFKFPVICKQSLLIWIYSKKRLCHSLTSLWFASFTNHIGFKHLINSLLLCSFKGSFCKLIFAHFIWKDLPWLTSRSSSTRSSSLWSRYRLAADWSYMSFVDSIIFDDLNFLFHHFYWIPKFDLAPCLFEKLIFVVLFSFCKSNVHLFHALNLMNLHSNKVFNDSNRNWIIFVNMVLCCNVISMFCNHWSFFTFSQSHIVLFDSFKIGNFYRMRIPLIFARAEKLTFHSLKSPVLKILFLNHRFSLRKFWNVILLERIERLGFICFCFCHILAYSTIRLRSFRKMKTYVSRRSPNLKVFSKVVKISSCIIKKNFVLLKWLNSSLINIMNLS